MAKLSIKAGSTSQTINVWIQDSSSATGAGKTGLAYNTSGLTVYYCFPGEAPANMTGVTQTVTGAWTSGGFVELSAADMPGWYRLDLPNAVLASGNGRFVSVHMFGAANMAPCAFEIELTGWDNQDTVHGGLSALPNAAAGAGGGLPTAGTGTYSINTAILQAELAAAITGTVNNSASIAAGSFSGTGSNGFTLSSSNSKYSAPYNVMHFTSGALQGLSNKITGYTGGTTVFAFATPWPAAPSNGDSFIIVGFSN